MVNNRERVCDILDDLTLDSLTLVEELIQSKIHLERTKLDGELDLAKARYIRGNNSVSQLQLPTEESNEFLAGTIVTRNEDEVIKQDYFHVEEQTESDDGALINPLKWFGILLPHSLHQAQRAFKQSINWAINSINLQMQLTDTLNTIAKLMRYKENSIETI